MCIYIYIYVYIHTPVYWFTYAKHMYYIILFYIILKSYINLD